MPNGPFAKSVGELDLKAALKAAARSNDLLPPRLEDKVGGEVGKRFSEQLIHGMETGTYEPEGAYLIPVPKPGFTTRLAALLTLRDRVVYQALVDALRPRIEQRLLGTEVVFGPRGTTEKRPWPEFLREPLEHGPSHIVHADIAGFYEVIPHDRLLDALIQATGRHEVVDALGVFLGRVMRSNRGIPQGLEPSDALATLYLTPVDRTQISKGLKYIRRGDDIRVAVPDYSSGRAAVAEIEASVRDLGLTLNPSKSLILKTATYEQRIDDVETAQKEFRERLGKERVARLYLMEQDEIEELVADAGLEQILWDMYHGDVDIHEIVEKLRPHLQPGDDEVASALFKDTVARAPGNARALQREVFHQRLAASLTLLTAVRSPAALDDAASLLYRFPDETEPLANYLAALRPTTHHQAMVRAIEDFLLPRRFRHGWQEGWLLQVIRESAGLLTTPMVEHLRDLARAEGGEWFRRVQAIRVLARRGDLDRAILETVWQLAPEPFRPDLIAAGNDMTAFADWALPFLEGCRGDPVHEVVMAQTVRKREI